MKLLALDLATNTGWCIVTDDAGVRSYDSGTWNLSGRRFDGGGMRYVRFREHLVEVFNSMRASDRVAYEEVRRHMGVDAAHVYGGLMAVLTEECERRGIPYEAIPVATIKRAATGKGNAKKDAMIAAAQKRWPNKLITSDDEADALWIAETVMRTIPKTIGDEAVVAAAIANAG